MKKLTLTCAAMICALSLPAAAQMAPAPRKMPRTPVASQVIMDHHDVAPAGRVVQGPAAIIDGEKLRIAETDLRLFGIVPPQLAASFGPQARAALDQLANGQSVSCQIRDRDRDGRLLATCHAANGSDMALELLKRGLAVTARGSISNTELAGPYLSAELAAQNQKLGLWSSAVPVAATVSSSAPKAEAPAATSVEAKKDDKPKTASSQESQAKITDAITAQSIQAHIDETTPADASAAGFMERYQLLITGLLMLATALSIITAVWSRTRSEKRDENKGLAAALRGELMAARGVCIGRLKTILSEEDDRAATWPRIRSTLYQAYVGRIGILGAELARQVASIYGQSSDYSSLYSPTGSSHDMPKRQALESLVNHIEEILPKLAVIEQTGTLPRFVAHNTPRSRYDKQISARRPTPLYAAPAPMQPLRQPAAITQRHDTQRHEEPAIEEPEDIAPAQPASIAPPASSAPTPMQNAANAWEAVRSFIQNHSPVPTTTRPNAAAPEEYDYAAIIEADMARYPYGDNQKKSG